MTHVGGSSDPRLRMAVPCRRVRTGRHPISGITVPARDEAVALRCSLLGYQGEVRRIIRSRFSGGCRVSWEIHASAPGVAAAVQSSGVYLVPSLLSRSWWGHALADLRRGLGIPPPGGRVIRRYRSW